MELSYSLHLGNDKNKSIKARQEAKNTPSGTTSKNNNAIQNVKQLGIVNHHNLRQYDNNQELIKTIKGSNDIVKDVKDLYEFSEIVPLSALKNNNVDELIKTIKNYLKDEIKYYEDNQITNKPLTFTIAEIVREKVFELTHEEVPHSLTCIVENIEKDKNSYHINVAIIVDRDSLKKIIIGNRGSKIKEVGILSLIHI